MTTTHSLCISYTTPNYTYAVDAGYKNTGFKNMPDMRTLYWKTVEIYPYIIHAGYKEHVITGIQCTKFQLSRKIVQ